ncbi:hypothetical protein LTS17_000697 [Exophiala oligosperma]
MPVFDEEDRMPPRIDSMIACSSPQVYPNTGGQRSSANDPDQLQRKIDKLEQLIVKLVDNARDDNTDFGAALARRGQISGSTLRHIAPRVDTEGVDLAIPAGRESVVEPEALSLKTLRIDAHHPKSLSIDEAHWARLLNEIGEVRGHVQVQQKKYDEQMQRISTLMGRTPEDPGPALLFGSSRTASRSEIVSQLPSRYFCDLMVDRYFSTLDPALYILHQPTFSEQYEAYWADPSQTSIVWIALLFGVLRVAMNDWIREGDEPIEYSGKCHDMGITFRGRLTDCLLLADYTRPHEHLIEVLILHLYCEYIVCRDAKSTTWVLVGMIVRLAMRMGYHQDTQPSLPMTPFHTEMRRRSWAFVRQADILFSFQSGLPSMVKTKNFEKTLPMNIYDDHRFHKGCATVPPPVESTEPTPVSYLLSKTRLAFGFAQALKEMNKDGHHPSYGRVFEIDQTLRSIYDKVPDFYKVRNVAEQTADPLPLVFSRYVLANIHYKSLCVLHSRYLDAARSNNKYAYSRRVCLESAVTMLRFHAIHNEEILVGGRMRSLTDYQTSLTIHDFLLAATVISAELCMTLRRGEGDHLDGPTTAEMLNALDTSANIFSQTRDKSIEAYKAGDVLGMILKKFQYPLHLQVSPEGTIPDRTTTAAAAAAVATTSKERNTTVVVDINEALEGDSDGDEEQADEDGSSGKRRRTSFLPRRLDGRWRIDRALCGAKPTFDEWPSLMGGEDDTIHQGASSSTWQKNAPAITTSGPSASALPPSSASPTDTKTDNNNGLPDFYPWMLDLSDPVSTLWSLNANNGNF